MNIFVFEWVTGGGLAAEALPPDLACEGDMMLRALLEDLGSVPEVHVTTSRDPRLASQAPVSVHTIVPAAGEDPVGLFVRGARAADAVWPIAPETAGVLEHLTCRTLALGKILLGSRPEAVRLTASKRATVRALEATGVPVVPTFGSEDRLRPFQGPWVVKPDDGVGCEGTRLVADWRPAAALLRHGSRKLIAQPWIHGQAASLSLLCRNGDARLLCANRQHVRIVDDHPVLEGITVNAVPDRGGALRGLASRIAAAIPGLWGYVGVDIVLADDGPVVLEINPRLTMSYCGLGRALGINTAALVLNGFQSWSDDDFCAAASASALVLLGAERGR